MYLNHVAYFVVVCGTLVVIIVIIIIVDIVIKTMDEFNMFCVNVMVIRCCDLMDLFARIVVIVLVSSRRLMGAIFSIILFIFVRWSRVVVSVS